MKYFVYMLILITIATISNVIILQPFNATKSVLRRAAKKKRDHFAWSPNESGPKEANNTLTSENDGSDENIERNTKALLTSKTTNAQKSYTKIHVIQRHENEKETKTFVVEETKSVSVKASNNETLLIKRSENVCDEIDCSRNIQYFQVYHISKCGGKNLQRVLKHVFNFPSDMRSDFRFWRNPRENVPDPRYQGNSESPLKKSVFILGLVRNPFSYYRSLYHELTSALSYSECKDILKSEGVFASFEGCSCELKKAREYNKTHLFLDEHSLRTNVSAFHEFVEFITNDETKICAASMQHRHDHLMLMNDGSMVYDSVVKLENYYPMMRKALQNFDCCMPNVTNFAILDQIHKQNIRNAVRHQYSSPELSHMPLPPDFCYYSPDLRRLVEKHDGNMMKRYNYTWESFIGEGKAADCDQFTQFSTILNEYVASNESVLPNRSNANKGAIFVFLVGLEGTGKNDICYMHFHFVVKTLG